MAGVDRKEEEEDSHRKIRPTCFNDFSQGFNWLRVRNKINHTYSSNYHHRDLPYPIIIVAVVEEEKKRVLVCSCF